MRYTGKILVNTRNIESIQQILSAKTPPTGNKRNELLSFLSVYALSDGLLYDGTVPEKSSAPAIKCFEDWKISKSFKPLKPVVGAKFENLVSSSLNLCHSEFLQAIKSYKNFQPVKDVNDAIVFFNYIEKIKQESSCKIRLALAHEAKNKDILGAKLIIALVHESNETLFKRVSSLKLSDNQKAQMLSAMVGTFRTFLLSKSAVENGALFNTDPQFVRLLEQRNVKTWNSLMKQFNEPVKFKKEASSSGFSLKWKSPLVGAAIIIDAAKKAKPDELLSFAKKSDSCNQISIIQKELINRYATAQSPNDVVLQMEEFWRTLLRNKNAINWKEFRNAGLIYTIAPGVIAGGGAMAYNSFHSPETALPEWVLTAGASLTGLMYQVYKLKYSYLNAMSNLSSYDDKVSMNLDDSFDLIWK